MAENPYPAGDYELLAPWAELVSKKGQPVEFAYHKKGDVVRLTQEDAERFCGGPVPVAQKPGENERQRAELLKAQAAQAQAQYEAAQDRAKRAQSEANSAAKQSSR